MRGLVSSREQTPSPLISKLCALSQSESKDREGVGGLLLGGDQPANWSTWEQTPDPFILGSPPILSHDFCSLGVLSQSQEGIHSLGVPSLSQEGSAPWGSPPWDKGDLLRGGPLPQLRARRGSGPWGNWGSPTVRGLGGDWSLISNRSHDFEMRGSRSPDFKVMWSVWSTPVRGPVHSRRGTDLLIVLANLTDLAQIGHKSLTSCWCNRLNTDSFQVLHFDSHKVRHSQIL